MKKSIRIIFTIYIVIAVLTTISLLTYNNYNISQIGNKNFIKLDKTIDNYKKGSLLIVNKQDNYKAGDNIFYCVLKDTKCDINYGKIDSALGDSPIINGENVSKKLIIGTDKKIIAMPLIGSIMSILESRWVYLCIIILPILLAFIYAIYALTKEVKKK